MSQLDLVRKQFPEYRDLSDEVLGSALHEKYFSDVPIDDYWKQVYTEEFQPEEYQAPGEAMTNALKGAIPRTWEMAKTGAKGLAATPFSPLESIENAGYGIAQGGREMIENAPGNMLEYAREHRNQQGNRIEEMRQQNPNAKIINADPIQLLTDQMIDYLKDKLSVSPENREKNRQFVESMRPSNEEGAAQEMWQGIGKFFPKAVATGGNPVLASILEGASTNTNAFENIVPLIAGKQTAEVAAPRIKKIVKGGAEGLGKGVRKGYEKTVGEPLKTLSEKGKIEKTNLETEKQIFDTEVEKTAAENAIKAAHENHTNENSGDVILDTAKSLTRAGKDIKAEGQKNYNEFAESKAGQKRVFKPIQPEFFDQNYHFPKGAISDKLQKKFDNILGTYESIESRNALTGQPQFNVTKNAKSPTVNDYIDLQRDIWSEVRHKQREAKSEGKTKTEADALNDQAESLIKLVSDINERLQGTLSEKQYMQHLTNQKFWEMYEVPFEESPTLKHASGNHPGIKTPKIIETLQKEGYGDLTKILLENESLAEQIGKHDWRSVNISNAETLGDALKGDLGKTLPPELKASLKKNYDILMDKTKTIEALKTKLKKDGLTAKEIDAKIKKYKLLTGALGLSGILGTPGVYFALKILT